MNTEIVPAQQSLQAPNQNESKFFLKSTKQKLLTILACTAILIILSLLTSSIFLTNRLSPQITPTHDTQSTNPLEENASSTLPDINQTYFNSPPGNPLHRDLEKKLETIAFGVESADSTCPPGKRPVTVESASYGDLTGDNVEDVAVIASDCLSGTHGANLRAVYKTTSQDSLVELKQDTTYSDKDLTDYEPQGTAYTETIFTIADGILLEIRNFYGRTTSTPNLLSTLKISYRWDATANRLVVISITNSMSNITSPTLKKDQNKEIESLTQTSLKTYTNSNYGFSFQYPSDWSILSESERHVSLMNPVNKRKYDSCEEGYRYFCTFVDFQVYVCEGGGDICDYPNKIDQYLEAIGRTKNSEDRYGYKELVIGGERGFEWLEHTSNEGGYEFYVTHNGRVYALRTQGDYTWETVPKITKEIVSTFKFLK